MNVAPIKPAPAETGELKTTHVTKPEDRIPTREKFAFGVRAFAQQLGNNGMTMLAFPAYGIILGLDPALIGMVFAFMRIYDGITDPLVGWLSDNTRTRWGRRRPWIFVGSFLGGIMFILLWQARPGWSEAAMTAYFIGFSLLFYTGFTMITVPTDALGWELTTDYAERTRLMSWFSVSVKISLLIFPWIFALTQIDYWEDEAQGLRVMGALLGVCFIVTAMMPALLCRERHSTTRRKTERQNLKETLTQNFKNKTYLLVCGIALSCVFGGQIYMLFGTHLSVYFLFGGAKAQGGQFFGTLASIGSILGLITVLVVSRFFTQTDKKKVIMFATGTSFVGWLSAFFLITPEFPWLTLVPIAFNAIGVGTFWLLLGSMMADVADADELASGQRREGMLAAFISFLSKVAGTLGAVLGGFALSFSGFDAELEVQPGDALSTMKAIYILLPLVGYGAAFVLASRYPLTKERMLEIRSTLEARRVAAGGQ